MTNATTFTQLPAATALNGTEVTALVQAGTSVQATINQIKAFSTSTADNIAGGVAHELLAQTAPGKTGFVAAPTDTNSTLQWNGSAFAWATVPQILTQIGAGPYLAGYADNVNLNATGDTAIPLMFPAPIPNYRIATIFIFGQTGSAFNTARVGLFTAASQGGTIVSALAAPPITATGVNTPGALGTATLASTTTVLNASTLYFNVGTPEGAAATANVYILIYQMP